MGKFIYGDWLRLFRSPPFTAFSLVLGQGMSIPVTLGAIFLMGVTFTLVSVTGIRQWCWLIYLRALPTVLA